MHLLEEDEEFQLVICDFMWHWKGNGCEICNTTELVLPLQ